MYAIRSYYVALQDLCGDAQVAEAAVGTAADKGHIYGNSRRKASRSQLHVGVGQFSYNFV